MNKMVWSLIAGVLVIALAVVALVFSLSKGKPTIEVEGETIETTETIIDIINKLDLTNCSVQNNELFSSIKEADRCVYTDDLIDPILYEIRLNVTDESQASSENKEKINDLYDIFCAFNASNKRLVDGDLSILVSIDLVYETDRDLDDIEAYNKSVDVYNTAMENEESILDTATDKILKTLNNSYEFEVVGACD